MTTAWALNLPGVLPRISCRFMNSNKAIIQIYCQLSRLLRDTETLLTSVSRKRMIPRTIDLQKRDIKCSTTKIVNWKTEEGGDNNHDVLDRLLKQATAVFFIFSSRAAPTSSGLIQMSLSWWDTWKLTFLGVNKYRNDRRASQELYSRYRSLTMLNKDCYYHYYDHYYYYYH